MTTEEKRAKIEDALKRAQSHYEDMRLSLALAEAQIVVLKRELDALK